MKPSDGDGPPPVAPPDNVTAGMTFAVTVGVAVAGGVWLDRRIGTMPLFTLLLTFSGIGLAGFWLYVRVVRPRQGRGPRR